MAYNKDSAKVLDELAEKFPDLSRTAIRLRMRRGDLVLLELAATIRLRIEKEKATAQKAIARMTAAEIAVACKGASGAMITEDEAAEAVMIMKGGAI